MMFNIKIKNSYEIFMKILSVIIHLSKIWFTNFFILLNQNEKIMKMIIIQQNTIIFNKNWCYKTNRILITCTAFFFYIEFFIS